MRTVGDSVMEHVKMDLGGTAAVQRLFGIEPIYEVSNINALANNYLAALAIIRELTTPSPPNAALPLPGDKPPPPP
jgi:hypothetical protein